MENASKALLIAGGILIALIIISMLILMFSRIANIKKNQEEQTKIEQLSAFNAQFEAYNKKLMYGVDVITLINKVVENNKKYSSNEDYKIVITLNGSEITSSNSLIDNEQEKYLFKCNKMEYNEYGRVCKIEIVSYN